jgi:hypothetical protein
VGRTMRSMVLSGSLAYIFAQMWVVPGDPARRGRACRQVRIPVGGAGGCRQTCGGGSGVRPGTLLLVRNTQSTCPAPGRAADGAINAGHPLACRVSPVNWYGSQLDLPSGDIGTPILFSRAWVDRSATVDKLICHRQRWRGICNVGRSANSARNRYHSAQAVSGESAKYMASTIDPCCQRPSPGCGG